MLSSNGIENSKGAQNYSRTSINAMIWHAILKNNPLNKCKCLIIKCKFLYYINFLNDEEQKIYHHMVLKRKRICKISHN